MAPNKSAFVACHPAELQGSQDALEEEIMTQSAADTILQHTQDTAATSVCWGRLMPTLPGKTCGYDLTGTHNDYIIGRSPKSDIPVAPPEPDRARQQWAYGLISNRHCKLYCLNGKAVVHDSSGNGTLVNRTSLRKGERRSLQSGDEICLVNPETLRKKVRSQSVLAELLSRYSYVFVDNQQSPPTQTESQTQSEILTQNPDLTQLGDDDDPDHFPLSPLPPFSPVRQTPWGRLMPTIAGRTAVDLSPRPPQNPSSTGGISFLGMDHLQPSDVFNEHVVGRSPDCDVVAVKGTNARPVHDWAFGMISNRHCKIYCSLENHTMQVFVEDCSGNGTLVNRTTLLRRGEKRLLHSGDELCLVNPQTLEKKVRSSSAIQELLQEQSFVFINLQQQQRPSLLSKALVPPSCIKRKAAVNPRAMRCHSFPAPSNSAAVVPPKSVNPNRPRRVEEDYDIRDLLGSGTVGQVRRAIHRQTGKERAVKIIGGGARNNHRFRMEQQHQDPLAAEAAILRELHHPYVVQLLDVYICSKTNAVYLVMELLHGGDLFDRIVDKTMYSEVESRRVMRRLLNAIHYLHEDCNIVHRDIKPENILLCRKDNCIDVKLTDFGLAKEVKGNDLKTFCGTPQYFAPEVLKRRSTVTGRGRYGKPADMWSLGVVLYVLLSGMPPFDDSSHGRIEFPVDPWDGISAAARDLIRRLLVADPRKRCTVCEACEHAWILTDDGDTHVHPLQDPTVLAVVKTKSLKERVDGGDDALNDEESAATAEDEEKSVPVQNPESRATRPESRKEDCFLPAASPFPQSSAAPSTAGVGCEASLIVGLSDNASSAALTETSDVKNDMKSSNQAQKQEKDKAYESSTPLSVSLTPDRVLADAPDDPTRSPSPRRPLSPVQLNHHGGNAQSPRSRSAERPRIENSFAPVPQSVVRFSGVCPDSHSPVLNSSFTTWTPVAERPARVSEGPGSILAAAELNDQIEEDDILSSFSEKTDSIDSFGSTGDGVNVRRVEESSECNEKTSAKKPTRKRQGDSLASLFGQNPVKKSKGVPGKRDRPNFKDIGDATIQTDIANWFQKGD